MTSFNIKTGQNTDIGAAAERLMVDADADAIAEARCLILKPLTANTGEIYLGESGVTAATGLQLSKTVPMYLEHFGSPRELFVIASVAGEDLSWLAVLP